MEAGARSPQKSRISGLPVPARENDIQGTGPATFLIYWPIYITLSDLLFFPFLPSTAKASARHESLCRRPRLLHVLQPHRPRGNGPRCPPGRLRESSACPSLVLTSPATQAQLAQSLFGQPMSATTSTHHRGTHANTPISCTPTATSFWERPDFDRRRSNSVASMGSRHVAEEHEYESVDAMDEDERMVEDMLFDQPSAPSAAPAYPAMPPPSPTHYARHSRKPSVSSPFSNVHYDVPPPNNSLFATTDPFYLAQLAASSQSTAPSYFTQFGKPSQQSPFLKGHPFAHRQNASEVHPTTAFVR